MLLACLKTAFFQSIEDELENINPVWKQQRFDSLPHVVEVLTSRDPQVALRSLRKQRDSIEDLVDDVVKGYHNGFNKAIHNYSQAILDTVPSAGLPIYDLELFFGADSPPF